MAFASCPGDSTLVVELQESDPLQVNARPSRLPAAIARQASPAFATSCRRFDRLASISIRCGPTSMALRASGGGRGPPATDSPPRRQRPSSHSGLLRRRVRSRSWRCRFDGRLSEEDVISFIRRRSIGCSCLGSVPASRTWDRSTRRSPCHDAPRPARVPAGSVAIAGHQTGIYPSESPGGWQLIGRTLEAFRSGQSRTVPLQGRRLRAVLSCGIVLFPFSFSVFDSGCVFQQPARGLHALGPRDQARFADDGSGSRPVGLAVAWCFRFGTDGSQLASDRQRARRKSGRHRGPGSCIRRSRA